MAMSTKRKNPKTILKLPDSEQSKTAVLNSLASPSSRRSYDHAIRDFTDWLLRTTFGVQQNRRDPVPHLARTAAIRPGDNQPKAGCGTAAGVRSI